MKQKEWKALFALSVLIVIVVATSTISTSWTINNELSMPTLVSPEVVEDIDEEQIIEADAVLATPVPDVPTETPTAQPVTPADEVVPTSTVTASDTSVSVALSTPITDVGHEVAPASVVNSVVPVQPVPNVVVLRVDASQITQLQAEVTALGGTVEVVNAALGAVTVQLPSQAAMADIAQSDYVQATEPDYFVSVQAEATDPLISMQWSLRAMNIPMNLPDDLPSVKVAVIDSGICDHPELTGRVIGGYDFVDNDDTPQDEMGHGCAVAGIIAAARDGVGMAGIAPNAHLLIYRVLNAQGSGRYSQVAQAIVRAVDDRAQIINLSLGGVNASQLLQDAVNYATSRGVLVIAAAGNNGSTQVLYPAAYTNVVSVGALDEQGALASFSNRGKVDVMAPGVNVLSLTLDGGYAASSGTSFAAPNVTGLAALELAHGRGLVLGGGDAGYGGTSEVVVATPLATSIHENSSNLTDAVILAVTAKVGQNFRDQITLDTSLLVIGDWAKGTALIIYPNLSNNIPSDIGTVEFLAQRIQQSWEITLADDFGFDQIKKLAPDEFHQVQSQSVNYNRSAGLSLVSGSPNDTTWWSSGGPVGNYRDGVYLGVDDNNNWRQGRHCTTKISQALRAGGVINEQWAGNGQVVTWMVNNPGKWEFRSGIGELMPGDFILLSNRHEVTQNWAYMDGYASGWNHIVLVTGSGLVGEWNPERYDIPYSVIHSHLPHRAYVHIKTTPTLNSPLNNDVVANRRPTFTWSSVPGASRYDIRYGTTYNLSGSAQINVGNSVNAGVVSWTPPSNLPTGAIFWEIMSVAPGDIAGAWSGPRVVYITNGQAPQNTNFLVNGTFDNSSIWSKGAGSLNYTISNGVVTLNSKPAQWAPLLNDTYFGLPANAPVEVTFRVRNTGTSPRFLQVGLNNAFGTWNPVCRFENSTAIPPGGNFATYTMRGRTPIAYGITRLQFDAGEFETTPNLQIDDVTVTWRPGMTIASGSGIDCLTPPTVPIPTLGAPAQGATTTSTSQPVSWSSVPGATRYEVRFGTTNPPTSGTVISTTLINTTLTNLLTGAYHIQVRAQVGGNWSEWSTVRSFTVASPNNTAPRVQRQGTSVVLTWNPQSWAQGYQVQVSSATNFPPSSLTQFFNVGSGVTQQALTLTPGTYYWRVCGRTTDTACGAWSVVETLIVR